MKTKPLAASPKATAYSFATLCTIAKTYGMTLSALCTTIAGRADDGAVLESLLHKVRVFAEGDKSRKQNEVWASHNDIQTDTGLGRNPQARSRARLRKLELMHELSARQYRHTKKYGKQAATTTFVLHMDKIVESALEYVRANGVQSRARAVQSPAPTGVQSTDTTAVTFTERRNGWVVKTTLLKPLPGHSNRLRREGRGGKWLAPDDSDIPAAVIESDLERDAKYWDEREAGLPERFSQLPPNSEPETNHVDRADSSEAVDVTGAGGDGPAPSASPSRAKTRNRTKIHIPHEPLPDVVTEATAIVERLSYGPSRPRRNFGRRGGRR